MLFIMKMEDASNWEVMCGSILGSKVTINGEAVCRLHTMRLVKLDFSDKLTAPLLMSLQYVVVHALIL